MSSIIPSAIIAINSNISNNTLNAIINQLNIDEIYELSYYIININNFLNLKKRILVLYPIGTDINLFNLNINVICKVKNGLISILDDMLPTQTFKIINLSWDKLKIYNFNNNS